MTPLPDLPPKTDLRHLPSSSCLLLSSFSLSTTTCLASTLLPHSLPGQTTFPDIVQFAFCSLLPTPLLGCSHLCVWLLGWTVGVVAGVAFYLAILSLYSPHCYHPPPFRMPVHPFPLLLPYAGIPTASSPFIISYLPHAFPTTTFLWVYPTTLPLLPLPFPTMHTPHTHLARPRCLACMRCTTCHATHILLLPGSYIPPGVGQQTFSLLPSSALH